jgi:hypothetical protein
MKSIDSDPFANSVITMHSSVIKQARILNGKIFNRIENVNIVAKLALAPLVALAEVGITFGGKFLAVFELTAKGLKHLFLFPFLNETYFKLGILYSMEAARAMASAIITLILSPLIVPYQMVAIIHDRQPFAFEKKALYAQALLYDSDVTKERSDFFSLA